MRFPRKVIATFDVVPAGSPAPQTSSSWFQRILIFANALVKSREREKRILDLVSGSGRASVNTRGRPPHGGGQPQMLGNSIASLGRGDRALRTRNPRPRRRR